MSSSLRKFAFLVAGPRDFIVNFLINGIMPWFLTKEILEVPIWGNPSLASLFLPMSFILVFFVSFLGFVNGLTEGKLNQETIQNLLENKNWLKPAVIKSIVYALLSLLIFSLVLSAIHFFSPGLLVPKKIVIISQALIAGVLAYFVQVNSVLKSKEL